MRLAYSCKIMKGARAGFRLCEGYISGPEILRALILVFSLSTFSALGWDLPLSTLPDPTEPPTAPPTISTQNTKSPRVGPTLLGFGPTRYSIGNPTDEEQLYLELANRSRANPTAEGLRLATTTDSDIQSALAYFGVNLALLQAEFSTNPPVPPLAMNEQLLNCARLHSGDMFTNKFQGHTGSTGSTLGDRLNAAGYTYRTGGENVYAAAKSVLHGHAGFNVDWGTNSTSVGGMQDPAGHRVNIHTASFREVGMGVVNGTNGGFGPQFITQNFGTLQAQQPLITGVAYYDLNTNGFYDVGEGLGGVTVSVSNASFYAVTPVSGGYAIPVPTNGCYTIAFTAPGLSTQLVATVSSSNNVKVDFVPRYAPPAITGPSPAWLNYTNAYSFCAIGGATNYDYRYSLLSPCTLTEGAEYGLTNITACTTAGYNPITNGVAAAGTYSFHLAHPVAASQSLTLKPVIRPGATSRLTFAKRLGYASTIQTARAQITTNNGAGWINLWCQSGTNGSGETSFTTTNISLAPYAGSLAQVRFVYDITGGGGYFPQTTAGVGLYIDSISISNAEQTVGFTTNTTASGCSFPILPSATNSIAMNVRPRISGRTLDWGPLLVVPVVAPPPFIQLLPPVINASQIQVDFTVANYRAGMSFQLWKTTSPTGTWTQDSSATLSTITSGVRYRETTTSAGTNRWIYRIKATY